MDARVEALGFKSLSDYLRHLHKAAVATEKNKETNIELEKYGTLLESHSTALEKYIRATHWHICIAMPGKTLLI